RDGVLSMVGATNNLLSRIEAGDNVSVSLALQNRGTSLRHEVSATVSVDADRLRWTTSLDVSELPLIRADRTLWEVSCRVTWRGATNTAPLTAAPGVVSRTAVRTTFRQTLRGGNQLRMVSFPNGDVFLRL